MSAYGDPVMPPAMSPPSSGASVKVPPRSARGARRTSAPEGERACGQESRKRGRGDQACPEACPPPLRRRCPGGPARHPSRAPPPPLNSGSALPIVPDQRGSPQVRSIVRHARPCSRTGWRPGRRPPARTTAGHRGWKGRTSRLRNGGSLPRSLRNAEALPMVPSSGSSPGVRSIVRRTPAAMGRSKRARSCRRKGPGGSRDHPICPPAGAVVIEPGGAIRSTSRRPLVDGLRTTVSRLLFWPYQALRAALSGCSSGCPYLRRLPAPTCTWLRVSCRPGRSQWSPAHEGRGRGHPGR